MQAQRKLVSYKDLNDLVDEYLDIPQLNNKASIKTIKTKQTEKRKKQIELAIKEESYQRRFKKRLYTSKANDKKKPLDSSEDEKEPEYVEVDDGKRDKIFSKFFLRSLSNQSKIKMAFIQQMGEDRLLKAEL